LEDIKQHVKNEPLYGAIHLRNLQLYSRVNKLMLLLWHSETDLAWLVQAAEKWQRAAAG